jgi:Spx/MgsR family transcriptional regulator
LDRRSEAYARQKQVRAEVMWQALERIIPDMRSRCDVTLVGTPLTHERFLRRQRGSYGPAIRAGQGFFPGSGTPLPGLLCCGDSTFPGIGLPAVAASGMIAANTLAPVQKHLKCLKILGVLPSINKHYVDSSVRNTQLRHMQESLKWLEDKSVEYEFINTKEIPPTREIIQTWVDTLGSKPMRNTSGQSYRALGDQKQTWTDEQWVEAFAKDAMLLKRPLFVKDGTVVLVGFRDKEDAIREKLKLEL